MEIKNIVFDLGGVLIDWNPRYVFEKYFNDKEKENYFLNNICTNEWNEKHDAGYSFVKGTYDLIHKFPEWEAPIREYYGQWANMLHSPIFPTVDVLRKLFLTKKYQLFALTNWEGTLFQIARVKYDFLQWFDGIVVSGEEKIIKPDPRIYQILLERYSLQPEQTIFIDDREKNCVAAKNLNFVTIQFNNAEQLTEELKKYHIEVK